MPSRPFSRKVVVLVLFAILALPLASAAEPRQEVSVSSLFERLWSFLAGAWSESGCRIDPDGNCAPEPLPTDDIDEGCRIDPDGRCSA
jgi:hypothetical protein